MTDLTVGMTVQHPGLSVGGVSLSVILEHRLYLNRKYDYLEVPPSVSSGNVSC